MLIKVNLKTKEKVAAKPPSCEHEWYYPESLKTVTMTNKSGGTIAIIQAYKYCLHCKKQEQIPMQEYYDHRFNFN